MVFYKTNEIEASRPPVREAAESCRTRRPRGGAYFLLGLDVPLFFLIAVVHKYAGAAIAFVTGSKTGMAVGITIVIVIVIIIVLCIRQAYKEIQEAKEKAMSKLGAIMKGNERVELLEASPDVELSEVQPASSDKKKLVGNLAKLQLPYLA